MIAKEKTLFITNFFPSYRKSIWKKLLNNEKNDMTFYFDPIQNDGIQVEELFFLETKKFQYLNN